MLLADLTSIRWRGEIATYKIYAITFSFEYFSVDFRYNAKSDTWTELEPMLTNRGQFALVSFNGRIFAIGGQNMLDRRLDSVEYYDSIKNTWQYIGKMNRKRLLHAAVVHNNYLFVMGGLNEDTAEYYDPTINAWIMVRILAFA